MPGGLGLRYKIPLSHWKYVSVKQPLTSSNIPFALAGHVKYLVSHLDPENPFKHVQTPVELEQDPPLTHENALQL